MTAKLTARDVIRIALDIEQSGMQTYLDMKERTPDRELAKLLEYLAREEQAHVAVFTRMFKEVELDPASMPDPTPEDSAYLDVVLRTMVFDGPKSGIVRARDAKSPVEMLKFALQFERDAMLFWMKIHGMVREQARPGVHHLIKQEEEHVREIDHLMVQRISDTPSAIHL
jgi:rubrerythrin